MKTFRIIAALSVLIAAAATLAACGGNTSDETEKKPETSFNFESIEGRDSETEPPVTETERETETEKAPETERDKETEKTPEGENGSSTVGIDALKKAETLIGTKFRLGGVGPSEFDNSGFIYYIFKEVGVEAPRLATGMATFGKEVKRADIKPGDVLVFANDIGGAPAFEGIFCGDNKFIACCNEDSPTDYQAFGNYWEQRFISARRIG